MANTNLKGDFIFRPVFITKSIKKKFKYFDTSASEIIQEYKHIILFQIIYEEWVSLVITGLQSQLLALPFDE